jgi:hypothetical protein
VPAIPINSGGPARNQTRRAIPRIKSVIAAKAPWPATIQTGETSNLPKSAVVPKTMAAILTATRAVQDVALPFIPDTMMAAPWMSSCS